LLPFAYEISVNAGTYEESAVTYINQTCMNDYQNKMTTWYIPNNTRDQIMDTMMYGKWSSSDIMTTMKSELYWWTLIEEKPSIKIISNKYNLHHNYLY
jgi:hypothetical protein